MYEDFYGLSGKPFSLSPDADFLFFSKRHRRALSLLEYGIITQAGFIVITGDVGAGKTTVIRRYLKSAGEDLTIGVITHTSKFSGRLLNWVAMTFEIAVDDCHNDEVKLYERFVSFLLDQYAKGKRAVLIIDEAQNLTAEALEELRMLSNVNNEKDQLLQIVLVGQPELLETLKRHELRQFAQRISVHCNLDPLVPGETAAYIRHRLGVVGGRPEIFDDIACASVHFFTGGVPRLINLLCDQALVYGFSEDRQNITIDIVSEVVFDRVRSGLSSFVAPPVGWNAAGVPVEIAGILEDVRKYGALASARA